MKKIKYVLVLLLLTKICFAQNPDSWTRVADFGGIPRQQSVSFSIDSFGYVCLGLYQDDTFPYHEHYPTDLWQYNPYTNVWTQKASFPIAGRVVSMRFVIGSKAYIGLGHNFYGYWDDIWEYDPAMDMWTQKASFPGGGREGTASLSIGGKGYVGLGGSDTANFMKDFWEYDPSTDTWTRKNNFPGRGTYEGGLFSMGSTGYFGFGYDSMQTALNDLWQYIPATDSWVQLPDFPGNAIGGWSFIFCIADKGYINVLYDSLGNLKSNYFWEYNTTTANWIQKDSFIGIAKMGLASFAIGNRAYVGTGSPNIILDNCVKDFWQYTPDSLPTGIQSIENKLQVLFYPNPVQDIGVLDIYTDANTKATIKIVDQVGREITTVFSGEIYTGSSEFNIDTKALTSGLYYLVITSDEGKRSIKFTKI